MFILKAKNARLLTQYHNNSHINHIMNRIKDVAQNNGNSINYYVTDYDLLKDKSAVKEIKSFFKSLGYEVIIQLMPQTDSDKLVFTISW